MTEPRLDGLHRLAVPDEQAGVAVPEAVAGHAVVQAGRAHDRAPHRGGEGGPADRVAEVGGEDEAVAGPLREVGGEGVDDDLGERYHPD